VTVTVVPKKPKNLNPELVSCDCDFLINACAALHLCTPTPLLYCFRTYPLCYYYCKQTELVLLVLVAGHMLSREGEGRWTTVESGQYSTVLYYVVVSNGTTCTS
jgi:hypothetical protein